MQRVVQTREAKLFAASLVAASLGQARLRDGIFFAESDQPLGDSPRLARRKFESLRVWDRLAYVIAFSYQESNQPLGDRERPA